MLHYKQIQYEFCSKGHIFFTQQQHNATYDTHTPTHTRTCSVLVDILYVYLWQDTDQMKALITTAVWSA